MAERLISCPTCGQHLNVPAAEGDLELTCPACGATVRVPALQVLEPPLPPPLPPLRSGSGFREEPRTAPPTATAPRTSSNTGLLVFLIVAGSLLVLGLMAIAGLFLFRTQVAQRSTPAQGTVLERRQSPFDSGTQRPSTPTTPVQTDPLAVEIPNGGITGTLQGQNFTPARVSYQGGVLHFSSGSRPGLAEEILIFPFLPGPSPAGKTILVPNPDQGRSSPTPHIHLRWREGNNLKSRIVSRDYAMRLEFGEASGDTIPGKIYLELPGTYETRVAGSFTAELTSR